MRWRRIVIERRPLLSYLAGLAAWRLPPILRGSRAFAAFFALGAAGCPPAEEKDRLYEPVPLEAHEVKVQADVYGDPARPAHVSLFLRRGELHVTGGGDHTLQGIARGGIGDAPPRVEVGKDRVAVVQSNLGAPTPKGDALFQLALGRTPVSLEVEASSGEKQDLDLGGVALAEARVHSASGHVALRWSAPNALPAGNLFLKTEAGYLDAMNLGALGGGKVNVESQAGKVTLDIGPFAGPSLAIDYRGESGILVVRLAAAVPARATVDAGSSSVVSRGWREEPGGFALGEPGASPRVTLQVRGKGSRVELVAE
jgi:hypothetical protein